MPKELWFWIIFAFALRLLSRVEGSWELYHPLCSANGRWQPRLRGKKVIWLYRLCVSCCASGAMNQMTNQSIHLWLGQWLSSLLISCSGAGLSDGEGHAASSSEKDPSSVSGWKVTCPRLQWADPAKLQAAQLPLAAGFCLKNRFLCCWAPLFAFGRCARCGW